MSVCVSLSFTRTRGDLRSLWSLIDLRLYRWLPLQKEGQEVLQESEGLSWSTWPWGRRFYLKASRRLCCFLCRLRKFDFLATGWWRKTITGVIWAGDHWSPPSSLLDCREEWSRSLCSRRHPCSCQSCWKDCWWRLCEWCQSRESCSCLWYLAARRMGLRCCLHVPHQRRCLSLQAQWSSRYSSARSVFRGHIEVSRC